MKPPTASSAAALTAILALSGCSSEGGGGGEPSSDPTTISSQTTESPEDADNVGFLDELPDEARVSSSGGDPRPSGYWALWNTCAPDNRSDQAVANGGREAGFVLVDDVLADPGIGLGEYLLTTCEESVALLNGLTADGATTDDPAYTLAQQLLAAELNLNVGAETCPAAEEAVVGAQLVLSTSNFDGTSTGPLEAEVSGAVPDLILLLAAYNSGDLCR